MKDNTIVKGYTNCVCAVAFSFIGEFLASGKERHNHILGSDDKTIRLWDVEKRKGIIIDCLKLFNHSSIKFEIVSLVLIYKLATSTLIVACSSLYANENLARN